MKRRMAFVFLIALVVLVACATPTTPAPTFTQVPPTATPLPTATPVPPTATPIPPTATPLPPTATPTPKPKVNVPSVTFQSFENASKMIESAGLKAEKVEEKADACISVVNRQDPMPGTELEQDSTVKLYLCVGPTPTPKPTATQGPTSTPKPPPSPTSPPLPSCKDTPPGMAGLLWINQFDGDATITIVDHEYRVPGNSRMLIPIPAGKKFVIDAFIPGVGRLRPAPGPFTWDAGYCEVWSPGRG